MAHVLVTGGTGFIGTRVVLELLRRGDRVRCLTRRRRAVPSDVEIVPGDITRPESLPPALDGIDVVYHLAGATLVCHPLEYRRVNARGTRYLARACAGLSHPPVVVYLSSLAAAGPSSADRPRRESDPPAPVSLYGRSKLAGERSLQAVADRVPTTVIRAPCVFGPGDPNTIDLFHTVQFGINLVPRSASMRLAWLHVDDLARALVLAFERGQRLGPAGDQGVYFAALDEQPTVDEVGRLAAAALGRKKPYTIVLPVPLCRIGGRMFDFITILTRYPLLFSFDKIREAIAGSWICRTERAKQELGFTCRIGLTEGFCQLVDWYRAHGRL